MSWSDDKELSSRADDEILFQKKKKSLFFQPLNYQRKKC